LPSSADHDFGSVMGCPHGAGHRASKLAEYSG
jgi:hypothetical protein